MLLRKTLSFLKGLHIPYLLLGALCAFIIFRAPVAFARSAAGETAADGTPAFAGMSQAAWNWFTCMSGAITYAATMVDPANASTPGNWSVKTRLIAFAVLGTLAGLLHFVAKDPLIPWTESLAVGFGTVVVPALLHFAPLLSPKARMSVKMGAAMKGGGQ